MPLVSARALCARLSPVGDNVKMRRKVAVMKRCLFQNISILDFPISGSSNRFYELLFQVKFKYLDHGDI